MVLMKLVCMRIGVMWQNEKNITAAGLDCKARGGRTRRRNNMDVLFKALILFAILSMQDLSSRGHGLSCHVSRQKDEGEK